MMPDAVDAPGNFADQGKQFDGDPFVRCRQFDYAAAIAG